MDDKEFAVHYGDFNITVDKISQVATDGSEADPYYCYMIWNKDMTDVLESGSEIGDISDTYDEAIEMAKDWCDERKED